MTTELDLYPSQPPRALLTAITNGVTRTREASGIDRIVIPDEGKVTLKGPGSRIIEIMDNTGFPADRDGVRYEARVLMLGPRYQRWVSIGASTQDPRDQQPGKLFGEDPANPDFRVTYRGPQTKKAL